MNYMKKYEKIKIKRVSTVYLVHPSERPVAAWLSAKRFEVEGRGRGGCLRLGGVKGLKKKSQKNGIM